MKQAFIRLLQVIWVISAILSIGLILASGADLDALFVCLFILGGVWIVQYTTLAIVNPLDLFR